jgi:hypothetical protein
MKKLSKILLIVGSVCMMSTASFAATISKVTPTPAPCMCIKAPCNCPDTKPIKKPGIKPNQIRGDKTVIAAPTTKPGVPAPDQKVAPTTSSVPK